MSSPQCQSQEERTRAALIQSDCNPPNPLAGVVESSLMARELRRHSPLLALNGGKTVAYLLQGDDVPHILREIGRLRELCFRGIGSGTGAALDLDSYDHGPQAYRQLVLWAPQKRCIVGGCRVRSTKVDGPKAPVATEDLFEFSPAFKAQHLPALLDIGRMFVHPDFQAAAGARGTFSLDNLWEALAAIALTEGVTAFFGRMVFPPNYHPVVRDLTVALLQKHFGDTSGLVRSRQPSPAATDGSEVEGVLVGKTWREDMRILRQQARQRGERVPALVRAYLGLSDRLRVFGTAVDGGLGAIEETCLLVEVADVIERKAARYRRSQGRQSDAA